MPITVSIRAMCIISAMVVIRIVSTMVIVDLF